MKIVLTLIFLSATLILLSGCVENTSTDSLIIDLGSENESVRTAAMDSLVEMGDEKTITSLVQAVKDSNRTIKGRKNAITVLGMIGDNSTAEMLLDISLDEEEDKHLRMASILALGGIGDENTITHLRELSYAADGLIYYHAVYVLDQVEDKEDVYASYGKLPYPLSDQQRLYRNNVDEIRGAYRADGTFTEIENATTILVGYNYQSGYIEVSSDVEPETEVMDEIYHLYDTQARQRGINQVPVRFVRCGTATPFESCWYNVSDFDFTVTHTYTSSDDDDDVKSQVFIVEFNDTNISF